MLELVGRAGDEVATPQYSQRRSSGWPREDGNAGRAVVLFGAMAMENNPGENEPPKGKPTQSVGALGQLVKAESFIQLAIAMPAGCVIGWLIGEALDKHFHQHWIGVVGILLGAAGGFIQIFLMASRYLKRSGD